MNATQAGALSRVPSQRRYAARAVSRRRGMDLGAEELAHLDRLLAEGLDAVA